MIHKFKSIGIFIMLNINWKLPYNWFNTNYFFKVLGNVYRPEMMCRKLLQLCEETVQIQWLNIRQQNFKILITNSISRM